MSAEFPYRLDIDAAQEALFCAHGLYVENCAVCADLERDDYAPDAACDSPHHQGCARCEPED